MLVERHPSTLDFHMTQAGHMPKSPAAAVEARPLLGPKYEAYRQWEQDRAEYFGAQLARVQSGQTELAAYARRLEAALKAKA